jgi:hypothetical protein
MAGQTTNYLFDYPTSTDYVKDGATAIETLADDVDATLFTALGGAYPGLRLIKKQTIGSAVSSVTVTGAFSATYDNYLITISGGVSSIITGINLTLGSTATGYYRGGLFNTYSTASTNGVNTNNGASYASGCVGSTLSLDGRIELFGPFLTKRTTIKNQYVNTDVNGEFLSAGGYLNDANSYTAFTLTPASGTLTGGTICVYGYGIS